MYVMQAYNIIGFNFLGGKSPSEKGGDESRKHHIFSCRAGTARSACGESLLCEAGSPLPKQGVVHSLTFWKEKISRNQVKRLKS